MSTIQDIFSANQDDDLKDPNEINDVAPDDDGIGENSEQTQLAKAVKEDEEKRAGKESAVGNNKPGATNENDNNMRIPTVIPDNDNLEAGPQHK
jgi:hypothetical protein